MTERGWDAIKEGSLERRLKGGEGKQEKGRCGQKTHLWRGMDRECLEDAGELGFGVAEAWAKGSQSPHFSRTRTALQSQPAEHSPAPGSPHGLG